MPEVLMPPARILTKTLSNLEMTLLLIINNLQTFHSQKISDNGESIAL